MGAKRYLAPVLLGFALSAALPLVALFSLSGFSWNLIETPTWVGFANFETLPDLTNSLMVTLSISFLAVVTQLVAGLTLGYFVSNWSRTSKSLAAVFLLPWLAAPIAIGVLWQWILAPSGGLLSNLFGFRIELLANPLAAPITIALISAWMGTGYTAMLVASGLRSIPRNTVDAARIDGANNIEILQKIQLPQIHKLIFFIVATLTLQAIGTFDLVVALTGGGPSQSTDMISLHLVNTALKTFEIGSASAMSILLMLFSGVLLLGEYLLYRFVVRKYRD
jgi:multiple sugar transport system permease protein